MIELWREGDKYFLRKPSKFLGVIEVDEKELESLNNKIEKILLSPRLLGESEVKVIKGKFVVGHRNTKVSSRCYN